MKWAAPSACPSKMLGGWAVAGVCAWHWRGPVCAGRSGAALTHPQPAGVHTCSLQIYTTWQGHHTRQGTHGLAPIGQVFIQIQKHSPAAAGPARPWQSPHRGGPAERRLQGQASKHSWHFISCRQVSCLFRGRQQRHRRGKGAWCRGGSPAHPKHVQGGWQRPGNVGFGDGLQSVADLGSVFCGARSAALAQHSQRGAARDPT